MVLLDSQVLESIHLWDLELHWIALKELILRSQEPQSVLIVRLVSTVMLSDSTEILGQYVKLDSIALLNNLSMMLVRHTQLSLAQKELILISRVE